MGLEVRVDDLCGECPYFKERSPKVVPPCGTLDAQVVIVGESPGQTEFERGFPFCGASGELLNLYISRFFPSLYEEHSKAGSSDEFYELRHKHFYITNACLCELKTPDKNYAPHCKKRLLRELERLRPKIIIALGALALKFLLDEEHITSFRGFVIPTPVGLVLPTYHPAYVLRVPEQEEVFVRDLAKAYRVLCERYQEDPLDVIVLDSPVAVEWFIEKVRSLGSKDLLAFDLETTGFDFMSDSVLCASFSFDGKVGYVLPASYPRFVDALRAILETPVRKTGANLKFDLKFLRKLGVGFKNYYFDVTIAQHTINENFPLDLTSLTSLYTNLPKYDWDLLKIKKGKKIRSYSEIPSEVLYKYAGGDAVAAYKITQALEPEILRDEGWKRVFWEVQLPTAKALAEVEYYGISVDRQKVTQFSKRLQEEIAQIEEELFEEVGKRFNWRSTKQLQDILFGVLKLPVKFRTAKGAASTNEDTLRELAKVHRVPQLLLKLRKRYKVLSTYLAGGRGGIYQFVKEDGRVHPDFKVTGTVTGRLSCTDPPLQTIPKTSVRNIFVAPPGYKLIEADLSQAELRVVAYISKCKTMLDALQRGVDLHKLTASYLFKKPLEQIDDHERKLAKFFNFGVCLDGDTLVVTRSGYKKIKDIKPGELVLTHKGNWKRVLDVHRVRAGELLEIATNTGKVIRCTPDHMILAGNRFVRAEDLEVGRTVLALGSEDVGCSSGERLYADEKIVRIEKVSHDGEVYDLTVEDDHSFVANGLFTHNCYGRGPSSVAEQFDLSLEEATTLYESFFDTYPEIREYMHRIVEEAKSKRIIRNLFGATRRFGPGKFLSEWERQAINFPIQSVVAMHTNQSMAILVQLFKKERLDAHVVLNVHDALYVECKEEIVDDVAQLVKMVMERPVADTDLVIPVEITIGQFWGEEGDIIVED